MARRKTHVSQMIQERLKVLGIEEGQLKPWAQEHDLLYQSVWSNAVGGRVSKDAFIVKLATRLGVDPVYAVLTAHADRAPEPFEGYFLAARQRYIEAPQIERGWAQLDGKTRSRLLDIIAHPDAARRLVKVTEALGEGRSS